jgi:hypothetical protein
MQRCEEEHGFDQLVPQLRCAGRCGRDLSPVEDLTLFPAPTTPVQLIGSWDALGFRHLRRLCS